MVALWSKWYLKSVALDLFKTILFAPCCPKARNMFFFFCSKGHFNITPLVSGIRALSPSPVTGLFTHYISHLPQQVAPRWRSPESYWQLYAWDLRSASSIALWKVLFVPSWLHYQALLLWPDILFSWPRFYHLTRPTPELWYVESDPWNSWLTSACPTLLLLQELSFICSVNPSVQ